MDKKVRIACVLDFPHKDPFYIYVNNVDEAKEVLGGFASRGTFQSPMRYIPKLPNIASIEVLNEVDNEWDFLPENESGGYL